MRLRITTVLLVVSILVCSSFAYAWEDIYDEKDTAAVTSAIEAVCDDANKYIDWHIQSGIEGEWWVFAETGRNVGTLTFAGDFWYVSGDAATYLGNTGSTGTSVWGQIDVNLYAYASDDEVMHVFTVQAGEPLALDCPSEVIELSCIGGNILGTCRGYEAPYDPCVLKIDGNGLIEVVASETDADALEQKHVGFETLMANLAAYYDNFEATSYLYYDTELVAVNFTSGNGGAKHIYIYVEDGRWVAEYDEQNGWDGGYMESEGYCTAGEKIKG